MARSNYADSDDDTYVATTYKDKRYSERAYTPSDSESEATAGFSRLVEESLNGDWSWKPGRFVGDPGISYSGDPRPESLERRLELELQMPTYRASKHPYYDGPADGAPGADEFQQRARAAHRGAGDYRRHPADMRL